ncbi:MAG: hypothetical protein ABIH37_00330 [archaeon]
MGDIRDVVGEVTDLIPVQNVLLSLSDKFRLGQLVDGLIAQNSNIRLISTGGTYKVLEGLLGSKASARYLLSVEEYTGFPEMEGGLVKTLHPKVHAGILGERNNPAHQKYLERMGGSFIDLVVVNLYPFKQVIAAEDCTFEQARGNIDIGGPTMLRGAAKNFLGCTPLCDPNDYSIFLEHLRENDGATTFDFRKMQARKAFSQTAIYDAAINQYLMDQFDRHEDEIREFYFGDAA